ncbi:MAG: class I SAM-dependent methyltransferase [Labilithrix sp.]|nr:class I SAM-dependent methyltransferase [Labilithrix sp.]
MLDHVPWPVLRRLAFAAEKLVSPSFVAHYALRKAAIREAMRAAVADGHRQVVLLGAGFDMMSMSVPDGARVFEVDLPATQEIKRHALREARVRDVTFVPADLSRARLRDVLRATPGFDAAADTLFVAEGLLMYLDVAAIDRILADLPCERRRTRVIASFVTPDARGRVRMHSQRRVVDLCMTLLGEEFVWGADAAGLRERLERHGLRVDAMLANADYAGSLAGRRKPTRSSGELIAVASSASGRARRDDAPSTTSWRENTSSA